MKIKPDQIPDEVVNTLLSGLQHWMDVKQAFAAALNAWPGAWAIPIYSDPKTMLHLPLATEMRFPEPPALTENPDDRDPFGPPVGKEAI